MFCFTSTLAAANAKKVPLRSEIALEDTWDLTLLYPNSEAWVRDFETLKSKIGDYFSYQGTLSRSPKHLLDFLEFDKNLDQLAEKLGHYSSLQVATDSSNNEYLTREAQLQNLLMHMAEVASFVVPEIQAIDDILFNSFLVSQELHEWKRWLTKLRRFKPHTLSQKEERILALSGPSLSGHDETFSQLMDVDMRFGILKDEKGQEVELSHSSYASFMQKKDPALRQQAFHQYYAAIDAHKYTLASTLANSIRADVFRARARNYPSALEQSLFPDAIPVSVYDQLIATVRKNLPTLKKYYALRKRVLKLPELHSYDTSVPLVQSVERKTTFDEAIELVLTSLKPLGSEYVNGLTDGLKKARWCDRYESRGKRSGAFSSSSYGHPPYILMNFKEDVFAEVYTLAHEAGHSMHSWYSQKSRLFQDWRYPIFLAEVASTFNEELLTHHLLEITKDPQMRAYIINRQIDDIRGTIYRQTMFAEFEKITHQMEEHGEALTLESFRTVYRKLLNDYFGEGVVLDPQLDLECFRIPHFYSAFYVYKYATGLSAAIALSTRVLNGGSKELEDYLGFLKSGCFYEPIQTLRSAGVDMASSTPIETALKLFSSRVDELEKLLT